MEPPYTNENLDASAVQKNMNDKKRRQNFSFYVNSIQLFNTVNNLTGVVWTP